MDEEHGLTAGNKVLLEEAGIHRKNFGKLPLCLRNNILYPPKAAQTIEAKKPELGIFALHKEEDVEKYLGSARPNQFFEDFCKTTEK